MNQAGVWLACALGCGGCGAKRAEITLGGVLSQTGSSASGGEDHLLAVQLAVDEINAGGGVLGSTLVLVNEDEHSDETRAAAAASKLIAEHHPAGVVGAIKSASTIAAASVTAPNQIVLISGHSTSPAITGLSPYVFRTCPSDALQGKLLAGRAFAKGFKRVALIHVPGVYGEGLALSFSTHFAALGGVVTVDEAMVENQPSYVDVLTKVFASGPDAVLLIAYIVDGAQIVRDYNNGFSFQSTFWFFTDSTEDASFVSGVGNTNFTFQHEGSGTAIPTSPAGTAFAAAFMKRYGRAPAVASPNVYDAAYLIALGIEQAGQSDGPSLREHLRAVSNPPGMVFGPGQWAEAAAAIRAGTKINFEGAAGSDDFDDLGDVDAPYDIWKVENGQLTIVERAVRP